MVRSITWPTVFRSGAGVDGHHSRVGIGRQFAENRVGEALFFANVLEEARGHAAAKKIVKHGDAEAVMVAQRNRRTPMQRCTCSRSRWLQDGWRIRVRRAVAFGGTRRVHAAELSLNQFQYLFVSDVAGSGDTRWSGANHSRKRARSESRLNPFTVSGVPRIGRPRECFGQKPRVKIS